MNSCDRMVLEKIAPNGAPWLESSSSAFLSQHGRRDFGIISEGCDLHAKAMAKYILGDESLFYQYYEYEKLHRECFVPVIIGMFYKHKQQRDMHLRFANVDTRKIIKDQAPAIVWWVGTDILNLKRQYEYGCDKRFVEKLNHPNIIHIAESEATREELLPYFDMVRVLPLPPPIEYPLMPIPPARRVAVYAPLHRDEFYHPSLIMAAANKMPDVQFVFYSAYQLEPELCTKIEGTENCWDYHAIDREDMGRLIADSRVYVRITDHDGLPLSVIEYGLAGRQIIFNHKDIVPVQRYFDLDLSTLNNPEKFEIAATRLAQEIEDALKVEEPDRILSDKYRDKFSHKYFKKKFLEFVGEAKGRLR